MAEQTASPIPNKSKIKPIERMTFPEAMQKVIEGERITKLEWGTNDEFCLLKDGWLTIHRHGKYNSWQVSDGDMLGDDWVLMPKVN